MNKNHQTTQVGTQERFLRKEEVLSRVGLKTTSLYARIKQGDFPASISLGSRAVGWLESEVDEWIADRIAEARLQKLRIASAVTAPTPSIETAANDDPAHGHTGL